MKDKKRIINTLSVVAYMVKLHELLEMPSLRFGMSKIRLSYFAYIES